jgi:hypothetical protein
MGLADRVCRGEESGSSTTLVIRRVGDTLEIGGAPPPPRVTIDMPAESASIGIDEDVTYPIDLRGVTRISVHRPEVMTRTSDGKRWLLGPEAKRLSLPNTPSEGEVATQTNAACAERHRRPPHDR